MLKWCFDLFLFFSLSLSLFLSLLYQLTQLICVCIICMSRIAPITVHKCISIIKLRSLCTILKIFFIHIKEIVEIEIQSRKFAMNWICLCYEKVVHFEGGEKKSIWNTNEYMNEIDWKYMREKKNIYSWTQLRSFRRKKKHWKYNQIYISTGLSNLVWFNLAFAFRMKDCKLHSIEILNSNNHLL